MTSGAEAVPVSKARQWTGWILTVIAAIFLIFDGATKVLLVPAVLAAMAPLGYPVSLTRDIGILLLVCTAIYLIPRTSVFGAIVLTGYLGGAIAAHVRIGSPLFSHILFGFYLGLMVWGGLWLRDRNLRALLPLRR